jgi:hypothetical protein
VGDGWTEIMGNYSRATTRWSMIYFVTLTIFGNIIMLNLFQAILLRQFEDKTGEDPNQSEVTRLFNSVYTKSIRVSLNLTQWLLSRPICKCFHTRKRKSSFEIESFIEVHEAQVYPEEDEGDRKEDMLALTVKPVYELPPSEKKEASSPEKSNRLTLKDKVIK